MSVPADRIAPAGTPEMVTLSVSEPSASDRPEAISNGMAVSSVPEASATSRVGASATASTVTSRVSDTVAVSVPSVVVAVTVNWKSASELVAGVMLSPSN